MKTLIHTHSTKAHKTVQGTYLDHQDIEWQYECVVALTRFNEVLSVTVNYLEGQGIDGPAGDITEALVETIQELAGDKALETLEREDFIIEEDYDI